MLMAMVFAACGGAKRSAQPKLPRQAAEYLETLGVDGCVVSAEFKKGYRWHHSIYSMGFKHQPDACWIVETTDSTEVCFSLGGKWLYTVTRSAKEDLDARYLADIKNIDRMLDCLQTKVGDDVHIVGVSKENGHWSIAAYMTHASWMGAPRFWWFRDDGSYIGCKIIA